MWFFFIFLFISLFLAVAVAVAACKCGYVCVQSTFKIHRSSTEFDGERDREEVLMRQQTIEAKKAHSFIAFSDVVFSLRFVQNTRDGMEFNLNV